MTTPTGSDDDDDSLGGCRWDDDDESGPSIVHRKVFGEVKASLSDKADLAGKFLPGSRH